MKERFKIFGLLMMQAHYVSTMEIKFAVLRMILTLSERHPIDF